MNLFLLQTPMSRVRRRAPYQALLLATILALSGAVRAEEVMTTRSELIRGLLPTVVNVSVQEG